MTQSHILDSYLGDETNSIKHKDAYTDIHTFYEDVYYVKHNLDDHLTPAQKQLKADLENLDIDMDGLLSELMASMQS